MSAPTRAATGTDAATSRRLGSTGVGAILGVGGTAGLVASLVLTLEKLAVVADPTYRPSCSINPVISCGSIMTSWQAELFGFPNPLLGLVGFTVVLTTGVAVLAGAGLPRWFWNGLFTGLTAAVAFVHWLIFQSLYRIEALCPYCMVVWLVTVLCWWYCLLHLEVVQKDRPARLWQRLHRLHTVLPTVWALTVLALVAQAFWSYWQTLL
ncbi:vitamin K epoxide reductase family protein [Rhodococcus pyridinivorans]|uniref:vitamin K epoxide reductase family protein n=1 Tax=Rhodococcus pyridinivorans TaxID=103816 RepID=UPI00190357DA|nr:vitamin K epoxide reductase family protein [Rhodococcus pyridinivorans]QQM55668.1 vitamin K epoxide reductase family protein [Rhodococcus pyridinivorans]